MYCIYLKTKQECTVKMLLFNRHIFMINKTNIDIKEFTEV